VHVEVLGGVDTRAGLRELLEPEVLVRVGERSRVEQVEDRAEVDVEALGPLPGEHPAATAEVAYRRVGELPVVRSGQWADVAWRAGHTLGELSGAAAGVLAGHRVELAAVPVRRVEGADRARVVEERVGVADLGGEPELVGDVRVAVAGVVDVDLVEDVVAELVEVRATGRRL
jgi:hypothetical protein